jgi:hypothetical protein
VQRMSKPKRSARRTRRPVAKPAAPLKKKPAAKRRQPADKQKATNVDGYVKALPPPMQVIVNRLRALVAAASPEAIEAFKWSQPVYEVEGPFAYIKAHRDHVDFGFWHGAALAAGAGRLEGDGVRMRHLKISALREIDDGLIKTLVQQAVLLNSRG